MLHLFRSRTLSNGAASDRVRVANHGLGSIEVPISIRFDADYADVFEVRGTRRAGRGGRLKTILREGTATLRYRGLDRVDRRTRLRTLRAPNRRSEDWWFFMIPLEQHEWVDIEVDVICEVGLQKRTFVQFDEILTQARAEASSIQSCEITSSNSAFRVFQYDNCKWRTASSVLGVI